MARIPHAVCTVRWDKPDKQALESACIELMAAHSKRRIEAMQKGEAFDEPMPRCPGATTVVGLTLVSPIHDSPAAAIASLESVVGELTEGVVVEVRGAQRTARVRFEGWIDGVGDRAAWAPAPSELQVAAAGVRFAVSVSGFNGVGENKAKAIEVAKRIAGALR